VARCCDYTVDKKRVNFCVLEHLFLEGVEQPKISPKKPGNALSDAVLMSRFQNFAATAAGGYRRRRLPPQAATAAGGYRRRRLPPQAATAAGS
jgi:hypothetical protein